MQRGRQLLPFGEVHVALSGGEHATGVPTGERNPLPDCDRHVAPARGVEQLTSNQCALLDRTVHGRHAQQFYRRLARGEQQGECIVYVVADVGIE